MNNDLTQVAATTAAEVATQAVTQIPEGYEVVEGSGIGGILTKVGIGLGIAGASSVGGFFLGRYLGKKKVRQEFEEKMEEYEARLEMLEELNDVQYYEAEDDESDEDDNDDEPTKPEPKTKVEKVKGEVED